MANGLYTKGIEQQGLGNIDFESDTIVLIPMATTHTFDFTGDSFISDIIADMASGASKITLASVTFNIDVGNTRVEFDATDVSEASQTFSSDKFIIAKDTGSDATSPLVCGLDNANGTASPLNGTYGVTVPAEGFFSISTS